METIQVYVRLGTNENERTLTFRRPLDISDDEILDFGYAIDGRDIMASVEPTADGTSLAENLANIQKEIRDWMKKHDHEVEFV